MAAWLVFLRGHANDGSTYKISDPMSQRLLTLASNAGPHSARLVETLLEVREVFPAELAANDVFRRALTEAVEALQSGARIAIQQYAQLDC